VGAGKSAFFRAGNGFSRVFSDFQIVLVSAAATSRRIDDGQASREAVAGEG
jgi:hypothetical protein